MTHAARWPNALLAVLAVLPAGVHAEGWTVSSGIEYSSGKYGDTQKTEMYNVPVTGKYETGLWTFRLSLPLVRVTGPGNVVLVGDDVVTLPAAQRSGTRKRVSATSSAARSTTSSMSARQSSASTSARK